MPTLILSLLVIVLAFPATSSCAFAKGEGEQLDLSTQESSEASADDLDRRILLGAARNAVHLGNLETAAQRFRRLLNLFPDQDQARFEYAGVLFQIDRATEAKQEYERLLKKHPDDLKIVRQLVDVLSFLDEQDRVRSLLERIVPRHPERVDFALELAKAYASDDELEKAREIARKYIVGKPLKTDKERINAVELFTRIKRPDLAKKPLAELLQTRPRDLRVLAAEIRYLILIEDWDLAVRRGKQLERLHPKSYEVQIELASALYDAQRYIEAGELFKRLLEEHPENKVVLLGNARVALRYNRLRRAWELIESVPEGSRDRRWYLTRSEFDIIAGNYRRAETTLGCLLDEKPGDREAALSMADLERAQQEFLKADARYECLGAKTGNKVASLHLAESLLLQKRFCEAESHCCEVLRGDPENVNALRQYGKTLAAQGRVIEALPFLRKAGEITNEPLPECVYYTRVAKNDPPQCYTESISNAIRQLHSASVMFSLAMLDGRKQLARDIVDAGLAVAPNNLVMQTHLAEWYASHGTRPCAAEAAGHYSELLSHDQDNQKWLLGLARADATRRCYDDALSVYDRLLAEQPRNYQIAREEARVINTIAGTVEGLRQYDCLISNWPGLPEERRRTIRRTLCESGSRSPSYRRPRRFIVNW